MTDLALGIRNPESIPKLIDREWKGDADRLVQLALENLALCVQGAPQLHAFTHMGGNDTVAGTQDPTDVDFGNVADPGTPSLGFAPIDHVHELGPGLAALEGLSGINTVTQDGLELVQIFDPIAHRLLMLIFLELVKLSK